MYHALLTNRYLTSRVIPLIAVAAVALCVALVIIVVSVMTGFLDMVRSSGRTLMGDVIVSYQVSGIPYYQRLIDRLEALPGVAAATPVVDGWGLLRMPYPEGPNKETETVQVWGVDPESFARVTGYDEALYWRPPDDGALRDMAPDDPRRLLDEPAPGSETTVAEHLYRQGLTLTDGESGRPGAVLGIHVSVGNVRQSDGSVRPLGAPRPAAPGGALLGHWWMPRHEVTLTVVPTPGGGVLEPESDVFPVVNEFFSGVFLIDDKRVMIPLAVAQRMLHLDEAQLVDEDAVDEATGLPAVVGVDPPRATMVLLRTAEGTTPKQLVGPVSDAYEAFRDEIASDPEAVVLPPPPALGLTIKTWEQQQAQFLDPIEKERELMRTLFSLVYLVCAGLVLSIFWAIVYEKTRDIGILRSIGASRFGISWIFLRYGLVVGIAGAIVGLGLAYLVVRNINAIHDGLGDPPVGLAVVTGAAALLALAVAAVRGRGGRLVPIVLGGVVFVALALVTGLIVWVRREGGIVVWDPSVYYFTTIPNELDRVSAGITMVGAVIFSLLGAFLPAAKAADTDPVQALRYE